VGSLSQVILGKRPGQATRPVGFKEIEMKNEHKQISISGTVTAVFARRFVVESKDGKHLADLGSEAVDLVALQEGDKVKLVGRPKLSEIKVTEIAKEREDPIQIKRKHERKKGHDGHHGRHNPRDAIAAVTLGGFKVLGAPLEKHKHFEILGRSTKGKFVEFHVELDGAIHKQKPADIHKPKWAGAVSEI
jgi:hypothetical protein